MLLDGETFDLVQHIETVLAAVHGHELEPQHQRRADAVGARDRDAGLPHAGRRRGRSCGSCAATSCRDRARARACASARPGTHPFSLFERQRITATRPLPAPRRPAPVRRAARADLRDARPRRGRRRREGDPGRQRAARAPAVAARALGELAVLARRADRARVVRGRWSSPRSPARARRPRFKDYADYAEVVGQLEQHRLHRGLHAHLVGHPPAPAARHRSRSASATPSRRVEDVGRDRGVLPGARQALLRAVRARARRSRRTTGS